MWRLRKLCNLCVAVATEISNRELNVTRVDAGSITAVVMLKLKWWRAGNGSVISVDRTVRLLEEKLQNALLQIDDLPRKNKALEEQLRLATDGREVGMWDTVLGCRKGGECLVLSDSIVRNVGTECSDMKVECFPGIRTELLHRVVQNRDLASPDTVVLHVGTNDLRTGNLVCVMGYFYDLVNKAKTKFSKSRVVVSGVLRRTGAVNSRHEWIANTLGVNFVDPNSWVDD